ncbi:MAG TPA: epoxide hydrolase [Candidatus Cybelea sp.]|nr:epoxide hydrolase [Candidatus Cybelea sp.]
MAPAAAPEPFRVHVDETVLADLRQRLDETRWPIEPAGAGWRYGADLSYMRRFVKHWRTRYDWRKWEAELNRFPQFRAAIDGLKVHYVIERGSGPKPLPLLLTHGWPGSVLEFYDIIEPLAHPERFGGSIGDAFTVVAPSLPGYGFSDAPPQPISPRDVAQIWQKLMAGTLGHARYVAQAGDWGAVVTSWLALDHPEAVKAIHLNMFGLRPYVDPAMPPDETETKWIAAMGQRLAAEGGYMDIQGTKPQTLSYGLTDSPAGLAAWIIEKFHGWSPKGGDGPPFDMDKLITNVMLYWINGFNASAWLYWSVRHGGRLQLEPGQRVNVPTAFAFFPDDLMLTPPERWAARGYNVVHRREFPRGGHFAALENGPLLVDEMRSFFRRFRD